MPGNDLFAAALSQHPLTAHAVGEVTGAVLEQLGAEPDLALLFVTPPHAGALEDAAATVRSLLSPRILIGCAAESVLGDATEVEESPGVTLWAGKVGAAAPVRLTAVAGASGILEGWPDDVGFEPQALVLLADPFSFPVDDLFAWLNEHHPGLPVFGGNASAARGPGGNRMALDGAIVSDGAVGVLLGPGVDVAGIVSQGCRPIGQPYVVTRAERNVVYELGGQPAYDRLLETARSGLSDADVQLINQGLFMGLVLDEHRVEYEPGDFLVRNVMGFDPQNGAIAVNEVVDVGCTAQYHVRDAATADEELRRLLDGVHADGALVFTCNGRGTRLFDSPNHDATVVREALGPVPAAGFFCQGEFGPVGGRNFVHGFTASVLLLAQP